MRKGSHQSPEAITKMRAANVGKKYGPEARANMSRSQLGRRHSEETKEKVRQAKLGKRHRPESILKMRRAARKRRLNGSRNPNWRGGGRRVSSEGYVMLSFPEGGRISEHRLVMEKKLGRRLRRGEIAHHINGNRQDNRPENLELMTASQHSKHHSHPFPPVSVEGRERIRIANLGKKHTPEARAKMSVSARNRRKLFA